MHQKSRNASQPGTFEVRRSTTILLLTILLAFALRVICLDCQSLWLDEATSAYRAALPLPALFQDAADNLHTPAYFLLLRGWVALTGMSAFSLRYFSVLTGILLLPVAFWFAHHHLHHRPMALLAATLAAISPAHIYYSQETRMYALLPVLYLLMIGLVLQLWQRPNRTRWGMLIALELLAIYLHLFSALMLVAVNLILALAYWRRRPARSFLHPWLGSQAAAFLAFVPWLWFTWATGRGLPPNLGAAAGAASFSLQSYLNGLWTFLLTGLIGVRPVLVYWSQLLALLLVIVLAVAMVRSPSPSGRSPTRRSLIVLILAFAAPIVLGTLEWRINPLSHPRYLLFLLGPLSILLAHALAWLATRRAWRPFAAATLFLILILDASALRAAITDPDHRRYNTAALAAAIARSAGPDDIVLMPPYDRSLWYYDPSPARVANWPYAAGNQSVRAEALSRLLDGYESAFLVEYHDLYSYDRHEQVHYFLQANGHLLEQFTVDRMDVFHVALQSSTTPQMAPLNVRCGPLRLIGAAYPQQVSPGDAPAVALRWRLEEETAESFVASARLTDDDQILAGADHLILDEHETDTASWPTGAEAMSYFVLPLPLGTPPLDYNLEIALHPDGGQPLPCGDNGDALQLAQVSLTGADQRTEDAYGTWQDAFWHTPAVSELAAGLTLEAFAVRPDSLRPGQLVYVTLRWRAAQSIQREIHPQLLLSDGDQSPVSAPGDLFTRYPANRWRAGDLFIETRELTVPATLDPLQLQIAVEDEILAVGPIGVDPNALQWSLPAVATPLCAQFAGVGALHGYRWQMADEGDSATLTLYWQGGENAPAENSYTVFAQLRAPDGWVLAQDDDLPADGERPTTTWLPGEIIADEHHIPLPGDSPAQTRLAVGLYELSTLDRVAAFDCDGNTLMDDAMVITP